MHLVTPPLGRRSRVGEGGGDGMVIRGKNRTPPASQIHPVTEPAQSERKRQQCRCHPPRQLGRRASLAATAGAPTISGRQRPFPSVLVSPAGYGPVTIFHRAPL